MMRTTPPGGCPTWSSGREEDGEQGTRGGGVRPGGRSRAREIDLGAPLRTSCGCPAHRGRSTLRSETRGCTHPDRCARLAGYAVAPSGFHPRTVCVLDWRHQLPAPGEHGRRDTCDGSAHWQALRTSRMRTRRTMKCRRFSLATLRVRLSGAGILSRSLARSSAPSHTHPRPDRVVLPSPSALPARSRNPSPGNTRPSPAARAARVRHHQPAHATMRRRRGPRCVPPQRTMMVSICGCATGHRVRTGDVGA
ncbi:uncharacterized protein TRAVEDRAFT_74274, partial [Trametes versicolor FP-101664 SS1]|uniref:uncharacterized protein n=1 Tax=Trametes versicolor (strain FP-101664) TaxID=717944 RepID=UPI00046224A4